MNRQERDYSMTVVASAWLAFAALMSGSMGGYVLSNALDRLVELLTRAHVLL